MDKSDQQQPMPPQAGAVSYAMQHRDRLLKIQSDYLNSKDPGDFWPGDIVLVQSITDTIDHFAAMVLGRYRNRNGAVYMVEDVKMISRNRGGGEIISDCDIVAPILLVAREGRNG